jgi:DNA-binding CsgD family transcriptional regulator
LEARSTEDAFSTLKRWAANKGIDNLAFLSRASGPQWLQNFAETTYPSDYLALRTPEFVRDDPVRNHGQRCATPFWWDDLGPQLSAAEKKVLGVAAEFGLASGICVPFFSGQGLSGGIALASSRPLERHPELTRAITTLAHVYNATYSSLMGWPGDMALPPLTSREIEILKWASQGSENWQIGEILHISVKTVELCLRSAFKKLHATNRSSAVVSAIRFGYFWP